MEHELKVWIDYYADIRDGKKNFEVRYNDRDFQVGDILQLHEYNNLENYYTGYWVTKVVEYILKDTTFGLKENWIVMGIGDIKTSGES